MMLIVEMDFCPVKNQPGTNGMDGLNETSMMS